MPFNKILKWTINLEAVKCPLHWIPFSEAITPPTGKFMSVHEVREGIRSLTFLRSEGLIGQRMQKGFRVLQ